MEVPWKDEDLTLWLLIAAILVVSAIAFWPLMTVFVWTISLAVALLPLHQRLSQIVKPSVSATFITLWVFLIILVVISVAANVVYTNIQYISTMATT